MLNCMFELLLWNACVHTSSVCRVSLVMIRIQLNEDLTNMQLFNSATATGWCTQLSPGEKIAPA